MIQTELKRIHFIAVGGSVMHNLALALHQKGITVSGSDDEIYEPAKSKLERANLNISLGWSADLITADLDAVILGMHAKEDNPELQRALELKIPIFSFPDFVYEVSKNKKRVVIGGSHGKSTITSMIMHVLKKAEVNFDYLVGAELDGFELTARLSEAEIIIIEGDEYLSSKLDPSPKFLKYQHHIGLISGIAWDHKNVFPTFGFYVEQFEKFIAQTPAEGEMIYFEGDQKVVELIENAPNSFTKTPYKSVNYTVEDGVTYLTDGSEPRELSIFGQHNMQNLGGALQVCQSLGISNTKFFDAISTFKGAAKRLQKIAENERVVIFKDYAHSPSKLKATIKAISEQYPDRQSICLYELHTFSSLDKEFLKEYRNTAQESDVFIIFVNAANVKLSQSFDLEQDDLRKLFNREDLLFITDTEDLKSQVLNLCDSSSKKSLAFLSSGNFGGLNLNSFSLELLK